MLSAERKERYRRRRTFTPVVEQFVKKKLTEEQWSPEQITGYAKDHDIAMVSHERIYQLIRDDKSDGGSLWKHTRHRLKHRKRPPAGKQISIRNKVSIDERPPVVETKERCGDWEIDTIIGKDGKGAKTLGVRC
jgi:IS30 family transposase